MSEIVAEPAPVASVGTLSAEVRMRGFGRTEPVIVVADVEFATPVAGPLIDGIVTELPLKTATRLRAGDPLLFVDDQPVVAVAAEKPFYRSLSAGDSGDDVLAVQEMLLQVGVYAGPLNGEFGASMGTAVSEFFARWDVTRSDIPLGSILAVPGFGEPFAFLSDVRPRLGYGAPSVLEVQPLKIVGARLTVEVGQNSTAAIGTRVSFDDLDLDTRVSAIRASAGSLTLVLDAADDLIADLCDAGCFTGGGAFSDTPTYRASLILDEEFTALAVASAAIQRDASGDFVTTLDGERIDVRVLALDNGFAGISGDLSIGTVVSVP